jgi:hypothetical protein
MWKIAYAGLFIGIAPGVAVAQAVLISHHEILKKCGKIDFITKTIKEAKTPEGQALIQVAASAIGVDPNTVDIAIATIPVAGAGNQQDTYPNIPSPSSYTICNAIPSNLNMGSGDKGIETHGDTTFNATIRRDSVFNGLAMYVVIPCKASTDTRVQSGFDVTFVKADPGWETRFPQCAKTGSHPWLARNNHTDLNVGPP